jgi:hypothetical protein
MAKKRKTKKRFVRPRADYKLNQTSGVHGDRRTKRQRDRSSRERLAVAEQGD